MFDGGRTPTLRQISRSLTVTNGDESGLQPSEAMMIHGWVGPQDDGGVTKPLQKFRPSHLPFIDQHRRVADNVVPESTEVCS
jgi:hypothetical protein